MQHRAFASASPRRQINAIRWALLRATFGSTGVLQTTILKESEMSRTDRGEIIEIGMLIRYPDGSSKKVVYDEKWILDTGAILIHENCMTEDQKKMYKGGEDWKNNPTFLKWERFGLAEDKNCPGGGACKECCACTSCK